MIHLPSRESVGKQLKRWGSLAQVNSIYPYSRSAGAVHMLIFHRNNGTIRACLWLAGLMQVGSKI